MASEDVSGWQKFGVVLSALGIGLGLYGALRPIPKEAPARSGKDDRLLHPGDPFLLIGDSIGVGIQHPLNALSSAYGSVLTSHVKVGTTVEYWSKHVTDSDGQTKLVVLSLGSNDAVLARPESEEAALATMLDPLRAYGALVLWLRPPSFPPAALTPGQAAVERLFWNQGVGALELYGPRVSVAGDPQKLHPSPQGYQHLAAQLFDALTRA